MNDLTYIDLFSGIGGFALAAGWAGFRTVAFCEIDPFCREVLKARFRAVADAPKSGCQARDGNRMGERTSTRRISPDSCGHKPILIPDIRDFDGTRFRGATLLTGGFPCQPFSHAGKRRGKEDDRYLWPEMLRVISEARPTWVIGENVGGLKSMVHFQRQLEVDTRKYTQDEMANGCFEVGQEEEREGRGILDEIVASLEKIGYEVTPIFLPAVSRQAPHERQRVWIVATDSSRSAGARRTSQSRGGPEGRNASGGPDSDARHALGSRTDARPAASRPRNPVGEPDSDAPVPQGRESRFSSEPEGREDSSRGGDEGGDAPDASGQGLPGKFRGQLGGLSRTAGILEGGQPSRGIAETSQWDIPWIEVATSLCRVDDGLPAWVHARRVARLKALGNAIVPQVAYQIIKGIAEIEQSPRVDSVDIRGLRPPNRE